MKTFNECCEQVAKNCGYTDFDKMCAMIGHTHEYVKQKYNEAADIFTSQFSQSHIQVVMQAEGSDEHICKYCGVLTSQPDEDCYKNPNRAEGAAVGQRSGGTGVSDVCCDHVEWVVRLGVLQCANCGKPH